MYHHFLGRLLTLTQKDSYWKVVSEKATTESKAKIKLAGSVAVDLLIVNPNT